VSLLPASTSTTAAGLVCCLATGSQHDSCMRLLTTVVEVKASTRQRTSWPFAATSQGLGARPSTPTFLARLLGWPAINPSPSDGARTGGAGAGARPGAGAGANASAACVCTRSQWLGGAVRSSASTDGVGYHTYQAGGEACKGHRLWQGRPFAANKISSVCNHWDRMAGLVRSDVIASSTHCGMSTGRLSAQRMCNTRERLVMQHTHLQQPLLDGGHVHVARLTLVLPVVHVAQVHKWVHRQSRGFPLRLQVLELRAMVSQGSMSVCQGMLRIGARLIAGGI